VGLVSPLVDVHAHFLPPWYVDTARAAGLEQPDGMAQWPQWSAAQHLAVMDERGIGRALLSLSSPGVVLPGADPVALARRVNDDGLALGSDRFGLLASLPLPDVAAALAELDRVLGLGADGVVVATNAGGEYASADSHAPLWEALAARGCPVLLHPTSPLGWEQTALGRPRPMAEFLLDTTRVVLDLALRGWLRPGLRLVVPHCGSLLPLLADRAALFQLGDPDHAGPLVTEALTQLWWDLAGTPTPLHVSALLDAYGAKRLLYGSDFCFTPPIAVDLQLGLLDRVWSQLPDVAPWRELTSANAARLTARARS
jgi:6-methylsalicylate decarboxylase